MSALEKYSSYKDSGVEWLGKVPEDWEILPGFKVYKENKIKNIGMIEERVLSLSYGNIIIKPKEKLVGLVPESFETYQIVNPGDIIIRCMDLQNDKTSLRTGIATNRGIITSAYLNLNIYNNFSSKYLHYYLHMLDIVKIIYKFGTGLRQNLNYIDFKRLPILFPNKEEQVKIANFLDEKTAQIDEAIKQKEELISLLKERRQVLIHKAVTQGLDSTVKMKDSGVEWIGEIPEHWEVLPGFRVYKENKTKNTGMVEEQVLSLSYGKIIIKPKEKLTGLVPESFETYQIVKPGDIIIRCMDLQNDQKSLRTGIAKDDGIITSAYLNLNVIKSFNSEYLHYYLHMLDITKVLYKFGTGLRQNLSYYDFKRLPVLVPDETEQKNIVEYIKLKTQKIDNSIKLQEKQIEKIKEYKATLIDSAVTGKVRVV